MNKVISEQKLEQEIEQLAKEVQPRRDLWLGIERAIALAPQNNRLQDITGSHNPNENKRKSNAFIPTAWAASVVGAVDSQSSINLASSMQNSFEQQKQFVLASFGQPELKQLPIEMQAQLSGLANARKAIGTALVNDPNNSELLNLLRWTQKQELDLLKQLYSPQWQTI